MRGFGKALSGFAFFLAATGWVSAFQPISWSDLGGALSHTDNPYFGLTADEARLLGVLVDAAATRKAGQRLSEREQKGEKIALAALNSVGIDGAAKVAEVERFGRTLDESRSSLNAEMLGQKVEIPGFVLPLEFSGTKVEKFLLVPYAGACIHTPPPPSNQIIFVQISDGIELRGLFDPVVVRGTLTARGESQTVGLSDGEAVFPVGYRIDTASAELLR